MRAAQISQARRRGQIVKLISIKAFDGFDLICVDGGLKKTCTIHTYLGDICIHTGSNCPELFV